jgi:hypothetical protein
MKQITLVMVSEGCIIYYSHLLLSLYIKIVMTLTITRGFLSFQFAVKPSREGDRETFALATT